MSDLEQRLRSYATHFDAPVAGEAADELARLRAENMTLLGETVAQSLEEARLRAENERLRAAALEQAAELCVQCADVFETTNEDSDARYPLEYAARMIRQLAKQP